MKCGGVNSITCTVPGESCIEGICRCGTSGSCENRRSGYYCDPIRSECLCSASLKSCSDTERGTICDQKDNSCKCSATTSACSGIHFCDNGSCIGSLIVLKLYVTMKYNWYVIFLIKSLILIQRLYTFSFPNVHCNLPTAYNRLKSESLVVSKHV